MADGVQAADALQERTIAGGLRPGDALQGFDGALQLLVGVGLVGGEGEGREQEFIVGELGRGGVGVGGGELDGLAGVVVGE